MEVMKVLKESGMGMDPGSGLPELVNAITKKGLGGEFTDWMKSSIPLMKGLPGELVAEHYNTGLDVFTKATSEGAGPLANKETLHNILTGMVKGLETKKDELGKESQGPIDVNGIDKSNNYLENIQKLMQTLVERSGTNNQPAQTPDPVTNRESYNMIQRNLSLLEAG
jgi:hypothetical protein